MHRFFGLFVLVAAATALPAPPEIKLEDIITVPSTPFVSSIMLPMSGESTAKIISAAPMTSVIIPTPQLRPVMITGDEMSPKVEEALEMKDDPIITEEEPNLEEINPEMPEMEKEEPKIESIVPELPKEEIKKPETLTDRFTSYIKVPSFSSLLPTISWPNWANILPIKWTTGNMPFLAPSRDIYYPQDYEYFLITDPKV